MFAAYMPKTTVKTKKLRFYRTQVFDHTWHFILYNGEVLKMELKPKKIAMTTHCPRRVVASSLRLWSRGFYSSTGNSLSLQVMVLIDKRVLKFIAASLCRCKALENLFDETSYITLSYKKLNQKDVFWYLRLWAIWSVGAKEISRVDARSCFFKTFRVSSVL